MSIKHTEEFKQEAVLLERDDIRSVHIRRF